MFLYLDNIFLSFKYILWYCKHKIKSSIFYVNEYNLQLQYQLNSPQTKLHINNAEILRKIRHSLEYTGYMFCCLGSSHVVSRKKDTLSFLIERETKENK